MGATGYHPAQRRRCSLELWTLESLALTSSLPAPVLLGTGTSWHHRSCASGMGREGPGSTLAGAEEHSVNMGSILLVLGGRKALARALQRGRRALTPSSP